MKLRIPPTHPSLALGPVRLDLYQLILESPGLHFRELQRRTKMATGQLLYHLHYMVDKSIINAEPDGQYLRFYAEKVDPFEQKVLQLVRLQSVRHILVYLMANNYTNHEKIAEGVKLSPSTTSWHLKKLVNTGIVTRETEGRKAFYYVNDPDRLMSILVRYRESFLDKLVDRFIEVWER